MHDQNELGACVVWFRLEDVDKAIIALTKIKKRGRVDPIINELYKLLKESGKKFEGWRR